MIDWFDYEKAATKRIAELEAEIERLKLLLKTARGSSFRWPEFFKKAVDAELEGKE